MILCSAALAGELGVPLHPASIDRQATGASTRAVRLVDEAVHALDDPSTDYRKILAAAAAAVPDDAGDSLRADIRRVLSRMPQPDADFRCSDDFVRSRAQRALLGIRDALLGARVGSIEPEVCYAEPFAVDPSRPGGGDGLVHIYGYDFDTVTLQMIVVTRDGYRDVTSALRTAAHHHLVLDLSSVSLSPNDVALGLAWGHLIRYSIVVIQAAMPLCTSRIETIRRGRTISTALMWGTVGSRQVAARDTRVWADVSLDYKNNGVEATICLTADAASDGTIVADCNVEFLYTTDPDAVLDGILGSAHSHVDRTTSRPELKLSSGGGPVRQWTFAGLRRTAADARGPSVTAELDAVRVVSTAGDQCISPQAYVEARRGSAVSAATRQRLDRQLEHVDREILKVAPRYRPRNR